jgi:DNA modification methylase
VFKASGGNMMGVACVRLGCKFIGIEVRPDYFELACHRIEAARRERDLFAPSYTEEPLI